MPIERREVFKAIFKSNERKPVKEEREKLVDRNKFVKSNVRYFAPSNEKVRKKVESIEKDFRRRKNKTKLMRFFDSRSISRSSPLDSRVGTYYEFENGLKMSILTTVGTEVSSITLNFELYSEDIKQEKIPGLYHFMIQLLFSEKFLDVEYNWNPLEPSSFRDYIKDIGGKINIQYIPSCIMISVGCPSKDYIKMLEHLFDAVYLTNKGKPRKLILRKSSIEQALYNMNLNYIDTIQDESYLRFEILRELVKKSSKAFQRTTDHKTIDILRRWSIGSESTVISLLKEGNLEVEVMQAYNRIIRRKAVIASFHSNLSHEKLFKVLNDFNIPILQEEQVPENSGRMSGEKTLSKMFNSNRKNDHTHDTSSRFELPFPVTLSDLKPSIIVNSPIHRSENSHGEIEIQWIIPAFYSSLSSSNSKPLKVISYLLESGSLLSFLNKRRLIKSISSGEVYFAAHSSQKLGFTIYSIIIKLSEKLESNIDPKSPIIQFIVQSIFAYFNALKDQIEESLSLLEGNSSEKEETEREPNMPLLAIRDILKIENYVSNSNYQMNSEKDNYIDYFDRNFEITEIAIQNLKSHNPSEVLVGNNRFYSKIQVILKYVKHTLENALKPSNFIIFISSDSFFKNGDRGKRFMELKLLLNDSPSINYSELRFDPVFLNLLNDPETLKKYVIKLDPLKQVVYKNALQYEYEFLLSPHPLLKNSELTFLDGEFEWKSFSKQTDDDNPIQGTTPYISEPTLISQDEDNRFLMYYSQVSFPDKSNEILQSSLSSAIIRWYENIDYSDLLKNRGRTGTISKSSILASLLSRILFTLWVATTLSLNFTSYRKIGATVNFQPCHHFGTALSTNCVQLQATSPSPMFPEYLKEVLKSIRTVSMLNISKELSESLKIDAIKEVKQAISVNSVANSCTDKVKQLLLPEVFSHEEILSELNELSSDDIMVLLEKRLDIKNPHIRMIGLITHIDSPNVVIDIVKDSLISNLCFNNFENLSKIQNPEIPSREIKYPHPILEEVGSSRTRLIFHVVNKGLEDQKHHDEHLKMLACTLWISVPDNNMESKSMLILLVRVIQFMFKKIYLPTSLMISKNNRKNINLLVVPSPFLKRLGLQLILEAANDQAFSSSDITTSALLLDFLSFIERYQPTELENGHDDSSNNKSRSRPSLLLAFRQIKTEVILQLLLSQTQIVAHSSYLFSRIVEILESNNFSSSNTTTPIANEKKEINRIIENTTLASALSFIKSAISNNSMILVESIPPNNNQHHLQNEITIQHGFKLANKIP